MLTLMGLPNEILSSIVEVIEPEDIESFSTCCKLLYALARDRLEEHQEKKTLFSTIRVENYFLPNPQPFPSKMYGKPDSYLKEFFSDERNRLYPKTMLVNLDPDGVDPIIRHGGSRRARTSAINGLNEFEHQLESGMLEVHSMIALDVGGIEAEEWAKHVKAGYPLATFLLLLALLPNLENLSINIFDYWPETFSANYSKIMRLMIEAALGQKENGLRFGGRLSECTVDGGICEDIGESLLPFIMMLPKMQKLQGKCLDIKESSWPYTDAVSPVVDLELHGGIESVTISNYIRGIKKLKRFQYIYTSEPDIDWEPGRIVSTLTQFAFRSLVHLDLTTDMAYYTIRFYSSDGIISLRPFEVLETIRLVFILLFKDVQTAETPEEVHGENFWRYLLDKSLVERHNLIDLLPSSVRIFQLEGIADGEVVFDTFDGFPEHRAERLPNLELISLDAGDEFNSQIEKICKEAGVQMESSKENSIFPDIS